MRRNFPSYNVYQDNRNEWRWSYEASNGLTIAVSSESYKRYDDAIHAVGLVKTSGASPVYVPPGKA